MNIRSGDLRDSGCSSLGKAYRHDIALSRITQAHANKVRESLYDRYASIVRRVMFRKPTYLCRSRTACRDD